MIFSIKSAFALIVFTAFAASGVCAQTPYAELDEQTRRLRIGKRTNIPQLAQILTQSCETEMEKCRVFFVWISENISYDIETLEKQKARETKGLAPQEASEVLIRRTGVCEGYVSLFIELCREVGIRTIRIPGHIKLGARVANVGHVWLMLTPTVIGACSIRHGEADIKTRTPESFRKSCLKIISTPTPSLSSKPTTHPIRWLKCFPDPLLSKLLQTESRPNASAKRPSLAILRDSMRGRTASRPGFSFLLRCRPCALPSARCDSTPITAKR